MKMSRKDIEREIMAFANRMYALGHEDGLNEQISREAIYTETNGELSVGDEVIIGNKQYGYLTPHFIITHFQDDTAHLINRSNGALIFARISGCHKTGKHFSIEHLFETEKENGKGVAEDV